MARITQQFLLLYLVATVPAVLADLASGTFEFVRKPSDAEVKKGSSHTVYCTVSPSNIPDIEYTWYKFKEFKEWENPVLNNMNTNVIGGMKSSQLFIPSADVSDTGIYMCKVSTNKYTIFSDTAHITVVYFEASPLRKISETLKRGEVKTSINCDVPNSDSLLTINWFRVRDGIKKKVQDRRMFVVPFQKNQIDDKSKPGSLVIVNVVAEDAGVYKCTTEYKEKTYELTEVTVTVTSSGSSSNPRNLIFYASPRELYAKKGGTVSLYCANYGKPLKDLKWFFDNGKKETPLNTADSIYITDYNRHLSLTNVQDKDEGAYICKILGEKDQSRFILEVQERQQKDIQVLESPTSFALKPNLYSPNGLNCSAAASGSITMMFMKNSKLRQATNNRVKEDNTPVKNGTVQLKLVMDQPNESDLGVYQCLLYNDNRLIERTAYITLEKDEVTLDRSNDAEYLYVGDAKTVDKAEEYCRNYFEEGIAHLVSILSQEENDKVKDLVDKKKDAGTVWLGLTKEVPVPAGSWKWVQPGDSSSVYSNWEEEKPFDSGNKEYAVMNAATGKWNDASKREKHAFVCKRYYTVCPSVDIFYEGRLRVRGWETVDTNYYVGERVKVYCSDVLTKLDIAEVECESNGTFSAPKEKIKKICPKLNSAYSVFMNLFPITVSVTLLLLFS